MNEEVTVVVVVRQLAEVQIIISAVLWFAEIWNERVSP